MKLTGVVLISDQDRGGRRQEALHTQGIRTKVVTGETVVLRKVTAMKGAEVQEVLPTLPH